MARGRPVDLPSALRSSEVGCDLVALDWARHPLGRPKGWPRALVTAVRVMLGSRFAMWMAWGEQLTFFCNDAYRHMTLGRKYPWALGRPASEVWAEIWDDIGPRIEHVLTTGEATWDEGLLLFLERSGYREETYHTFSYSPLPDDDGLVRGMLCVVSEDTDRVINARRMTTLRHLGTDFAATLTAADVLSAACTRFTQNDRDFPFAAIYLVERATGAARLGCATPRLHAHPAIPELLPGPDAPWPLPARDTVTLDLSALPGHGGSGQRDWPSGAWPGPPVTAAVRPLVGQRETTPRGWLIVGLNPHRPFDEGYRGLVELVTGQIAAALSAAGQFEAERARAAALAELDAAKTAFFTNVSHELRTPLTLILAPAQEVAAADPAELDPVVAVAKAGLVERNAQRLQHLVDTLLDFSRVVEGRARPVLEPLELTETTGQLVAMFDSVTAAAGLKLTTDLEQLPEPVRVDPEMWAKIVCNLLSNALKCTFSGGINVGLHRIQDPAGTEMVELAVTDTGIGIDADQQDRIFDRFHRVPGARTRSHEGFGIGLALVAELVELHHGSVDVRSKPGEGSTFTVRLPVTAPPAAAGSTDPAKAVAAAVGYVSEATGWLTATGTTPEATGPPAHHRSGRGTRPVVLVVEDDPDMRGYLAGLLAEDYEVAVAADGAQALERVRAEPPDLVLTDVMMPGLDGFGLLAALRADPATAAVPVVMLSARAGEEGVVEGLEAGADDYLVKPFTARELQARVRANLEPGRLRRVREELARARDVAARRQIAARATSALHRAPDPDAELRVLTRIAVPDLADMCTVHRLHRPVPPGLMPPLPVLTDRVAVKVIPSLAAPPEQTGLAWPGGGDPITQAIRAGRLLRHPMTTPDVPWWARSTGSVETFRGGLAQVTLAPVTVEGLVTAVVSFGALAQRHWTEADLDLMEEIVRAAGVALGLGLAHERTRNSALVLQRSLLTEPPTVAGLDIHAVYLPAGHDEVGGDWYDIFERPDGAVAVAVGDVVGHDITAAAAMAQLRATLRAIAVDRRSVPARVLQRLAEVNRELQITAFATAVHGCLHRSDHPDGGWTFTWAGAGHPPPVLIHRDPDTGQVTARLLEAPNGPALTRAEQRHTYTQDQLRLGAGDTLLLYTDGLIEYRRDPARGLAELTQNAAAAADLPLPALCEALVPEPGHPDDVVLLAVRVTN